MSFIRNTRFLWCKYCSWSFASLWTIMNNNRLNNLLDTSLIFTCILLLPESHKLKLFWYLKSTSSSLNQKSIFQYLCSFSWIKICQLNLNLDSSTWCNNTLNWLYYEKFRCCSFNLISYIWFSVDVCNLQWSFEWLRVCALSKVNGCLIIHWYKIQHFSFLSN